MLDVGKRADLPGKENSAEGIIFQNSCHNGTGGGSKYFAGFWITAVRESESFEHTSQMHLQKWMSR